MKFLFLITTLIFSCTLQASSFLAKLPQASKASSKCYDAYSDLGYDKAKDKTVCKILRNFMLEYKTINPQSSEAKKMIMDKTYNRYMMNILSNNDGINAIKEMELE